MAVARTITALLSGALTLALACPASAENTAEATSTGYTIYADNGPPTMVLGTTARVVGACLGTGSPAPARTVIICDIYDSSGEPSLRLQRSYTGAYCLCVINVYQLVPPIEVCATVIATFSDLSTATDTECAYPDGAPAAYHTPFKTSEAWDRVGQCLDMTGPPIKVIPEPFRSMLPKDVRVLLGEKP